MLLREATAGRVHLYARTEMPDLLLAEGRMVGVVVRDLESGRIHVIRAHTVVFATGGYGSCCFSSILAKSFNVTAVWRAHRADAAFTSPSFV